MVRPLAWLVWLGACLGCGQTSSGGEQGAAPPDLAVSEMGGGACHPDCPASTRCNPSGHCVACIVDGDCPAGSVCKLISDSSAICTPGCKTDDRCAKGAHCCGGKCVDTTADPSNCGACGMPCTAVHADVKCVAGKCASGACDTGWGDCNMKPDDGCEANLHLDVNNCTMCGMKCAIPNAVNACGDGCYEASCNFGHDDCNGDPMDGCETATLMDPMHCGSCDNSCGAPPHGSATCQAGACVLASCVQGYLDCNGVAMDGCEVAVASDLKNCGACGNVCAQGLVCKQGGCTCPNCMIPNASALCVNNQCIFDKCNPGFFDCNKNIADGCEANLNNDPLNCSACGMGCNGKVCLNGMCTTFRPNVMLCGGSGRSPMTFYPMGANFALMNGCAPDSNTQAMFVTRGGAGMINAMTLPAYVSAGGIVLTEYNISQTVWSAVFGVATPMGARQGSCTDVLPSVVQMNPNDPFWRDNQFMAIPAQNSGCGYSVSGFAGITTLAGWDANNAGVGYRALGQGRVWATDFDWQDGEMQQPYTYTNQLMGYMMTHR